MHPLVLKFLRSENVPLRVRKKLGKILPFKQSIPFTMNFLGANYSGTTGSLVDNKMYLYGRDEAPTLRLIQSLLRTQKKNANDKTTFVDIGVNTGVHLVCGAVCADFSYGFEPWDRVRNIAQHNMDLNKPHHGQIFPFGLSDTNDMLPFLRPSDKNLGMGAFVRGKAETQKAIHDTLGVDMKDAIQLEVRKGDDVMRENDIRPSVIKIDTEGFEKFVLDGLKDTLAASRPAIIFEYSDITKSYLPDKSALLSVFPAGYDVFGILRSREYPKLAAYSPTRKFENLLAIPVEKLSLLKEIV